MTRSKKLAGGLLVAILALAGCNPVGTFTKAEVQGDGSVLVEGTAKKDDHSDDGTRMLFIVDKTLQIVVQPQDGVCRYICWPRKDVIRDTWELAPGPHDICATALNYSKPIPDDLVATPIKITESDTWIGCKDIVVPGPSVPTTTTTTVPETTTTSTTTTSTTTTSTTTTTITIPDPGPPPSVPDPGPDPFA